MSCAFRSQAPCRWANRSLLKAARDSNPESPDFCPKQHITWKIGSALNTLKNRWLSFATSTSYNKIRMEVNGTNPWISQSPEDQDNGIPIYDLATVHKYIRGWGGKRTPKEQKGKRIMQRLGIEPRTSAVLKPRHNQLDHLCKFMKISKNTNI